MQLFYLKRFRTIVLLPIGFLMVILASKFPNVTETIYSRGIYKILSGLLGRVFSSIPFSMAEILLLAFIVGFVVYVVWKIRRFILYHDDRQECVTFFAANLICIMSVGYFVFVIFCGLNYHRLSFAEISGLEVRPSSAQEVQALCQELVEEANRLRELLPEDQGGVMTSEFSSHHEATTVAIVGYENLGRQYDMVNGFTVRPKKVLLSRRMSKLDLVGIYIPFTFEPNVNVDIVDYNIPSSMMHELAHYKGFMREDEANFISYLACTESDNLEFRYSGTMLALSHSRNALYRADRDLYWETMDQLSDGVQRDFDANSAYWKEFEGPVAEVSTAVNNAYLKSNNQSSGVQSYGRMVDLLLADYRQRHG